MPRGIPNSGKRKPRTTAKTTIKRYARAKAGGPDPVDADGVLWDALQCMSS